MNDTSNALTKVGVLMELCAREWEKHYMVMTPSPLQLTGCTWAQLIGYDLEWHDVINITFKISICNCVERGHDDFDHCGLWALIHITLFIGTLIPWCFVCQRVQKVLSCCGSLGSCLRLMSYLVRCIYVSSMEKLQFDWKTNNKLSSNNIKK